MNKSEKEASEMNFVKTNSATSAFKGLVTTYLTALALLTGGCFSGEGGEN